ncbi:MAG: RagB/SusD family nutrient uptake outer membrane protein [Alistipes sp.]|nr:RagB/SusD family nutrient uptake outer membrane protein [Alistipes sp.]
MKKFLKNIFVAVAALPLMVSCEGMLDEPVYGQYKIEDMVADEENVVLLVGQSYADLKWLHDHWGYWGVSSLTSDECVCPTRMPGEHWKDSNYWMGLHTHKWNMFGDALKNIWNSTISGAVRCNQTVKMMTDYKENFSEKTYTEFVAELEILRSYYYFLLFDCFGRVPYVEEYVEKLAEPLVEPNVVWAKLVTCLEKNAPNMVKVTDANRANYYGRVSQGFAYTLLARLYLNAECYGITPESVKDLLPESVVINSKEDFYTNAVRCCDEVIDAKSYTIESNFFTNFKIDNEGSKENIFVLVENGVAAEDLRYNGSMMNKLRIIQLSLHYCHQQAWDMIEKPWNGFSARKTFLERYASTDVRGPGNEGKGTLNTKQWGWFVGPVCDANGNVLKDENKTPAVVVPEITSLEKATWNDGARMLKYEVDKSKSYEWGENDFVLMRYADVLWMKEEAILRGGTGTSGFNTPEFETLKKRAFAYDANPLEAYHQAYPDVQTSLDAICDERGREFAWENLRRRDLIRFGKYHDAKYMEYVEKTGSKIPGSEVNYLDWFPIPYSVLEKSVRDENGNRIWTQNYGY